MKERAQKNGTASIAKPKASGTRTATGDTPSHGTPGNRPTVAKVSHTLSVPLAERLESFAFFQRVSESAVIEHALKGFFEQSADDAVLGERLRSTGAGRRRKA